MHSAKSEWDWYKIWLVFGPCTSSYEGNGKMTMMLPNYRSSQFHRTSNRENLSNSFRDMHSTKYGQDWYQIWQVFGPWTSPYGASRQMTIILHYKVLDNSMRFWTEKIYTGVSEIYIQHHLSFGNINWSEKSSTPPPDTPTPGNLVILSTTLIKVSILTMGSVVKVHQPIRTVTNGPRGCFTNISWALQNVLSKFVYCRNHTSRENFKLKLCTCAQSHTGDLDTMLKM